MIHLLKTRRLKIQYEDKKLISKFVVNCSQKYYDVVVVLTLESLGPIVYDKYQETEYKFWDLVYEMVSEKSKINKGGISILYSIVGFENP